MSRSIRLSSRSGRVQPSPTLALNARAKALQAEGKDLVAFGAGEPDFPTPAHIVEATVQALKDGQTRYTPSAGIPKLRAAIADQMKRGLGLEYKPEQVIVGTGAKMVLYELFQALLDEGDEVIVPAPYWVSYPDMVALAGGKSVIVQTSAADGFVPDPEKIRAAITPRTRAIVINSPSNPTGAVWPREALEAIARVLEGTDIVVISDDIYDRIIFDGRAFSNIAQLGAEWQERTVVVNGVSKAYAMTGFRIGWAAGPRALIGAMNKVQDQSTSGPTTCAQFGALAALTGPQEPVEQMRQAFSARRDVIVAGLNAIPGVECPNPGGAFYAFPSIASHLGKSYNGRVLDTDAAISEVLLEDFGLAVVPGEPFGAPGFLRLSYATSLDEIRKGVERLGKGLAALS